MSAIDWSTFDAFPEIECECTCGAVWRSHAKYTVESGLVSRKSCPRCGRHDIRRASGEDSMTMGSQDTVHVSVSVSPASARLLGAASVEEAACAILRSLVARADAVEEHSHTDHVNFLLDLADHARDVLARRETPK